MEMDMDMEIAWAWKDSGNRNVHPVGSFKRTRKPQHGWAKGKRKWIKENKSKWILALSWKRSNTHAGTDSNIVFSCPSTHVFMSHLSVEEVHQVFDASQRKANPWTGNSIPPPDCFSSDISDHLPMFTCFFFVADADILDAVCKFSKKVPASFKKICSGFIGHHCPLNVWKMNFQMPHKRKLSSMFGVKQALARKTWA